MRQSIIYKFRVFYFRTSTRLFTTGFRLIGWPLLLSGLLVFPAEASEYFVSPSGNDTNTGTSWIAAKQTIQAAVDASSGGDTVWVTNGIYNTGGRAATGDNLLTNRVVIDKALTVRSVNGPLATVIVGAKDPWSTNGFSAIRCIYMTNGAAIVGFTLTNGATMTDGPPFSVDDISGGAVWCVNNDSLISNCIISGNSAHEDGGGVLGGTVYNCTLSGNNAGAGGGACQAMIFNCDIVGNESHAGGGAHGSTLSSCSLSGNRVRGFNGFGKGGGATSSMLTNCILTGNTAEMGGGAEHCTLINCIVSSNFARYSGGGVCGLDGGTSTLYNCILAGNAAYGEDETFGAGGGVYGDCIAYNCTILENFAILGGGAAMSKLVNCLVSGNNAQQGGGAYRGSLYNCTVADNEAYNNGGGIDHSESYNSIIWSNAAGAYGLNYSDGSLSFCCTFPAPTNGEANIVQDPQFVSLWRIAPGSPCRSAGSSAYAQGKDMDGEYWNNPPAIGADEPYTDALTGLIAVAISSSSKATIIGEPVKYIAHIDGKVLGQSWDYGDGVVISNCAYTLHSWFSAGVYSIRCRAWNISDPIGVTATVAVRVVSEQDATIYVSQDGNDNNPGTNWATAKRTIQAAVDDAPCYGVVWVTNGNYNVGARPARWKLLNNRVAIEKPLAVRSVNGPAATIISGMSGSGQGYDAAVRGVYLASNAVLDGFTITNGNTTTWYFDYFSVIGGGIYAYSSSMITNCWILNNHSSYHGGGVYRGSIYNCLIANNSADHGGGGVYGGALHGCMISENSSLHGMGGGASWSSLANCILSKNIACQGGGIDNCTPFNCEIDGNTAVFEGGGAFGGTLLNCTLTGNAASEGGGAYYCRLRNCIVLYNHATSGSDVTNSELSYCCSVPMIGEGNITNDPLFICQGSGYGTNYISGNYRLQSNSPCINSGSNQNWMIGADDLDGNPRIANGIVDIGAYERQGYGDVPTIWMAQYSLPTNGSADYRDSDGDGMNNWQEWRCGTVPTNSRSFLEIMLSSRHAYGSNVILEWSSVTDRTYSIKRSTNMFGHPSFVKLATNIPGQYQSTTYTDLASSVSAQILYYRINVE